MNKILKRIFAFVMVFAIVFTVSSCKKDNPDIEIPDNPPEDVKPTTISLSLSSETIKKGETVTATVTVENAKNNAYTYMVSDTKLLKVENDKITVVGENKVDKIVTVVVTLTENPNVSATKTIKVIAPVIEGQVGELTSKMLETIGNQSITAIGKVTDYYTDFNQGSNSSVHVYNTKVTMEEGRWSGEWNLRGNENVLVDTYRRGDKDGLKDQAGNVGHAIERLYIDKNNQVASAVEKDYISVPAIWEAQHLWNHLSNLQINKFTYDAENDVYAYTINQNDEEDLYLMTYLSYCLTPMVSDTLLQLYLKVENGEIVKLLGQTEILYYGSDTREDADAMSYTTIEIDFEEVGTTKVADPTPFDAPDYADKLIQAMQKMAEAKNYTFRAKDTTTYAPSTDDGDYSMESVSTTSAKGRLNKVYNNVSSVGTEGTFGQVTENAILLADTGKYSYSMDGKNYHTEYSGYKQIDENSYDFFEYNGKTQTLYGTKKLYGNIFDSMPKFDFSANVFEFVGMTSNASGKRYTFELRETQITRDVALEISSYKYAKDAKASTQSKLQIVVDDNGNLVSTNYPYSLVSGTYLGNVQTTYSLVGSTVLDEDLFDGYTPRTIKTSWSEYVCKYYSASFSTHDSHEEDCQVVLSAVYGESAKDLPSPNVFIEILGDNIYGPFYDWKQVGTDADGNPIQHGYISINAVSDKYDENYQITNYEELMEELQIALAKEGFTLSVANTDTSGGATGRSSKYVCFIKGNIQIVIENIGTRYLYVYFYQTGDWTLKR